MWIAQISDPHLRPRGESYRGAMDTGAALARAVEQINALRPRPGLVVLTGDVTDAALPAEYDHAREILARLEPPLRVLPGNHDTRPAFRAAFHDHAYLPLEGAPEAPLHFVEAGAGDVRVIGLDVTVPGLHHGEADAPALAWLEAALAAAPERPTLLLMHQPPLSCGVPYLDAYRCRGEAGLARLIARFPCVVRIACGHVHRAMVAGFGGTVLCTAPCLSTAIALRPWPGAEPASFLEPPGFLLHHWRPGEGMLTHAVPLGPFAGPFPFA